MLLSALIVQCKQNDQLTLFNKTCFVGVNGVLVPHLQLLEHFIEAILQGQPGVLGVFFGAACIITGTAPLFFFN